MSAQLLVSLSGIVDDTRRAAQAVAEELDAQGVAFSLLIAPHIDGAWSLAHDPATLGWVRERIAGGTEWILNGFDQAAQGRHAEFAQLAEHEARLRLRGATRQMKNLGLATPVFAPPRWRLSPGTLAVLPEFGFRVVGSTKGVYVRAAAGGDEPWECVGSRNLSVGEGFGAPGWWRRNVWAAARRGAQRGALVRLSASARNLRDPQVARDFLGAVRAAREEGAVPTAYGKVGGK
ncbi:DUF2334 domain-containing protein [Corynebacterium sp. zg-331]|uniref:DUF2334 domain-containing protein n=1 Tax=unclassified Corynebacterium TaxID=2624378 RepID=UPI00128C6586|nr:MULTISPECIES: DUF2334 domain-containing protein [unclassified Corynebacterium]MBC3185635.1 DUF2334 domain-containing protein [Corynebacterium sp. zg-331]MPV52129.1 DUF2334 domain-containing protein [Corynebacterium sp. zg331]